MAVDATVLTLLKRRHDETYLAQLTRRDDYDKDDSTNSTIDEDVLQVAIDQAQHRIQLKIGPVAESHPGVIELVPYFLGCPGEYLSSEDVREYLKELEGKKAPAKGSTNATAASNTTDNNRRRFTGDDYMDLENKQGSIRGRRSKF